MRLVKLEVTNWRGLQKKEIEFGDGVTVVGGPNECGKTSLREALRAALLLPTGARGEKKIIEAHRPWDTRLFPAVKLELIIDDKTCVVEKEFLRNKDWATLRVNGKLIAQDEAVQPKLLDLLGPTAEWIDALWSVQGDAKLDCQAPESVKGRLAAAARDTVMPQVTELEQLINDEYENYWTAKRAQPNKKLQDIRAATTAMENRVSQIKVQIKEADQQSSDIDRKSKELEKAKAGLNDLESQWKIGQSSLSQWETFARAELEATEAGKHAARCAQWMKSWEESFKQIPFLSTQSAEWLVLVESLKKEVEVTPSRGKIDTLLAKQNYLLLSIAADRYRQVTAIQVPTTSELARLKQQQQSLTEVQARLSMGVVRAKLIAEKTLDVVLTTDNNIPESVSLSSGAEREWTAEDRFSLHLPGVAKLQIESGNPSIKDDLSKRTEIEQEIAQVLQRWKAVTIDELHERSAKKEIELRQVRKIDDDEFKKSAASLGEADGGLSALSIEDRERLAAQLSEEIAASERDFKEAQEKYQLMLDEYHRCMAKNIVAELDMQMRLLREYNANNPFEVEGNFVVPEQPNQPWLETAKRLVLSWTASLKTIVEQASDVQNKLVRPDGEPVTKQKLEQLEKELDVTRETSKVGEAAINQAIGIIAGQGDLYARLVSAEEDLAKAESVAQRENINAMAVKELFLAFEDARMKLQKDVVAPLADSVTKSFFDLTKGFYDRVVFDGSLKMSGLATQTIDNIPLDDISFGTREQLLLLTRLCLAELLSQSGAKQVVILDDNLVHTDSNRMEFACKLLQEKAKSVQVVVFTCHPERYSTIADCRELIMA